MVLLLPERKEVPEQHPAQQGHRLRLLEGHRHRPPDLLCHCKLRRVHRAQEVPRVLPRQRRQGHQDRLDDARVPPPAGRRLPEHARSCKCSMAPRSCIFHFHQLNSHSISNMNTCDCNSTKISADFHASRVCEITIHGALPHIDYSEAREKTLHCQL